jgi:hypothetical protein
MKLLIACVFATCCLFVIYSCKDNKEKNSTVPPLVKKDKPTDSLKGNTAKGPIVNIIDTIEIKRTVLCVKDSAASSIGMSIKLAKILNHLLPYAILKASSGVAGPPMVWYKSQKAPFFFEAGIPIDKIPTKISKGFFIKKTGGDSVLLAHFFGPNILSSIGYEALSETLKDRKKIRASATYEIYINNPFAQTATKADPYKMQTDIVMPYK